MDGLHRHGGDLQFVNHQPGRGQGNQASILTINADDKPAVVRKLPFPLLFCPEASQGKVIQPQAGTEVVGTQFS